MGKKPANQKNRLSSPAPTRVEPIVFIKQSWPDVAVYAITIVLCLLAYFNVIVPTDTFQWDASHHTLYATWIANDLQTGNWEQFWQHTNRQTLWPFLHSWLLGTYFVIFGISYISARVFQLSLFFILLLSTWHIGKAMDQKDKGYWIGGFAWGLLIFSANSWFWGLEVMIDIIAVLITIFCFFTLLQLERTKNWIWIVPSGALLGMILVTKYNYALHLYTAFAVWALYKFFTIIFQPLPDPTKKINSLFDRVLSFKYEIYTFVTQVFLLSLSPLFTFFAWMFGPNSENKWAMISYSKETWVDPSKAPGFFDQIIYYTQILVTSYTWVPILGGLTLIGLSGLLFMIRGKDRSVILLNIFIWTGLPILFWVFMYNDRYIYSLVPLIYLAAAVFWISIWEVIKSKFGEQRAKTITIIAGAILALLVIIQSGPMFNYFSGKTHHKEPGEKHRDVLDYIAKVVPPNAVIACGSEDGSFLSPYSFGFYFQHHLKDRTAPAFDKYSLPYVRFEKGIYLVAFRQEPTPEKMKEDQWSKMINSNLKALEHIDSKYFSFLKIKVDIYRIK